MWPLLTAAATACGSEAWVAQAIHVTPEPFHGELMLKTHHWEEKKEIEPPCRKKSIKSRPSTSAATSCLCTASSRPCRGHRGHRGHRDGAAAPGVAGQGWPPRATREHSGGQGGTQGSNIHGTNSPSRDSNAERNNKPLPVIQLISSWIGKVWPCLGGCGRPLWLELERPQKSTSPLGSSGKHGSAPADSHCPSLGCADGATPPLCRSTSSSPELPWRKKPRCSISKGSLPRTPDGAPWVRDPR
ncbi:epidermal growth factor-like protein 7 isoform X2 [Motacilla alba alba]|uniref:epidermal growth factor-like protein 7 isoform X2 n=1 Tax=Motacilla alba alba TaxID=1094192 RepID=UPI0018D56A8F|nr:epidermal growth factor-like protein 7 isoform X2 [Motacilla alba alba]